MITPMRARRVGIVTGIVTVGMLIAGTLNVDTAAAGTRGTGVPLGRIEAARALAPVAHRVPLARGVVFAYSRVHHDYPATDILAACNAQAVAPVSGVVLAVRTVDLWRAATDNPAYRGGRYVSLLGADGVRYYMAHFASIQAGIVPGVRVRIGQPIARVGHSGRAGACHVHLGLSVTCPGKEWAVRHGVVWPWRFLNAWRAGDVTASPRAVLSEWTDTHRAACAAAMAMPTAKDA